MHRASRRARSDKAGILVGKKNRPAIGCQNSNRQVSFSGNDGVSPGCLTGFPGFGCDDDVGAVGLIGGNNGPAFFQAEALGNFLTIQRDIFVIIIGAVTAVQAGIDAG